MANIEEGVRRLALALGGLAAGAWVLFVGFASLSEGDLTEFALYGFVVGVVIFGGIWTLVRVLGWAVGGFVDR